MRYLYRCENCGEIEVVMSYKDLPLLQCPDCKRDNPERVYTSFYTGNVNGFCGKSNQWNNTFKNTGK